MSRTRDGANQSWTYDHADRFTLSTGATVDNNSNATIIPGFVYNYDGANRLTQATGGGYVISYNYDGDGRRTQVGKQVVGGGAVYNVSYVHDVTGALPLVLQESRSGVNVPTETRKYVWGAQGLAYMTSSLGNVDVFHTDRLGSVRTISDVNAQVVQIYSTDEYGVTTDSEGNIRDSFQWAGEERDENGLMFLRARAYHPDTGRFLQRDPLRPSRCSFRAPLELNGLAYSTDNPINQVDPGGLKSTSAGLTCSIVQITGPFGIQLPVVSCQLSDSAVGRPVVEDCPQDCIEACQAEQLRCEQDWFARRRLGEVSGRIECAHGEAQCESTGGCFLNPGWRQDQGHPQWDEVWFGRRNDCQPQVGSLQ